MSSAFGVQLRDLRIKCKKTLKDLAEALDVSVVYVSDIERGKRNPPAQDKIHKIASFFHTSPSTLLEAAALDRDRVELELDGEAESMSSRTALALARRWSTISDEELNEIMKILSKE